MSSEERFISRLTLRRDSGAVGALIAVLRDGLDPARAHKLLWTLFADKAKGERILFRRGGGYRSREGDFLVVSRRPPQDAFGLWTIETKPYDPELAPGQTLSFLLRANPTVTREAKRHDVVMDAKRTLKSQNHGETNAELWARTGIAWLERRAARLGMTLGACRADGYAVHRVRRDGEADGKDFNIASLDFSGTLTVADPAALRRALLDGVGHGKAWGCGLLLVKPI